MGMCQGVWTDRAKWIVACVSHTYRGTYEHIHICVQRMLDLNDRNNVCQHMFLWDDAYEWNLEREDPEIDPEKQLPQHKSVHVLRSLQVGCLSRGEEQFCR